MKPVRIAVVGAGAFGKNHARVLSTLEGVDLVGILDIDPSRASQLASEYGTMPFSNIDEIVNHTDAAVLATPTSTHEVIASALLEAGLDILIEKPIASSAVAGERLTALARSQNKILQVGHLERFNPAVTACEQVLTIPLFFEVHRLSVFTPRSLDIDVVLDLMIHDLDIVLNFTRETPQEIRAAGISVLSSRVDIANVRLSFPSGCVANLTASRVSTEQVRKLRLFQPGEYISLDYHRQDAVRLAVGPAAGSMFVSQNQGISFNPLPVTPSEPLKLELQAFCQAVRDRSEPRVDGGQATNALRVAEAILDKIGEHAAVVAHTLRSRS